MGEYYTNELICVKGLKTNDPSNKATGNLQSENEVKVGFMMTL